VVDGFRLLGGGVGHLLRGLVPATHAPSICSASSASFAAPSATTRITSSSVTHRASCRSSSAVRGNLARAATESFAHVVCRLRGMAMEEERAP
jgi:hypothetical protein